MSGDSSMTQPSRRSPVDEEAAAWLATLTDAACTNDERARFVAWLRRSNLHVEEFLLVSATARRLTGPDALPRLDVAALVEEARVALSGGTRVTSIGGRHTSASEKSVSDKSLFGTGVSEASGSTTGVSRTRSRAPWLWALAACATVVAVLIVAVTRHSAPPWSTSTYSTSLGELRSIRLEDGSLVELNTRSTVRTRFTRGERQVELLAGEAAFRVAKDASRPFRVRAGSAQIVAIGTAFNVYAQSARTVVVTVLEGRVRVRGDVDALARVSAASKIEDQGLELATGEQAVVAGTASISKSTLSDPAQVTSWRERRLVFDETPLAAAAAEFARYNVQRIRLKEPALGELHITGVFDATDPASLVQFVEAYAGVVVHADAAGWVLTSAGSAVTAPVAH